MQIAVIGAGLAGLTAARDVSAAGHGVVVWEKSRGSGGRTATRRGPAGQRFDHGAPVLHDASEPLSGVDGLADYTPRYRDGDEGAVVVGYESNNGPAKRLAASLDVRLGIQVAQLAASGAGWSLADDAGTVLGVADAVIVTAPAPQTAVLLRPVAPALADRAASATFAPCWSVMVSWPHPLHLPWTAARDVGELSWALAEGPKPARAPGERWVLQASAAWSQEHLEDEPDDVVAALLASFATASGQSLAQPDHVAAHRWRYARPIAPLSESFLRQGTLLVAGDWCGGDTAGAAIRSGRAAAAALLAT